MHETELVPALTAYLAGERALEPVARAFADAYVRDGWALYLDVTAGLPDARARAAALWAR